MQATVDLEVIDKERKDEFKKYEMEKEYLRKDKLKNLDEQAKAAEQAKFEEMQQKHKDHPKLHHPVSCYVYCTMVMTTSKAYRFTHDSSVFNENNYFQTEKPIQGCHGTGKTGN